MYVLYNPKTGEFLRYNNIVLKWPQQQESTNEDFKCVELTEEMQELIFNQNLNNEY